jgi:hypothetical protein
VKRCTIDAADLRFFAQQRDDAASVGDIVHVPGKGDRIGAIDAVQPAAGTVTVELLPGTGRDLARVIERWFNFTGMEPRSIEVLPAPKVPDTLYKLGTLLAVEYECVKDGKRMAFRHPFKKSARPALAVSPDGRYLGILGGEFQVTERGIVDKR